MERVRRRLEELLEEDGHKPMLFPLVATEENFGREAEHIKGFKQEVFTVTMGGGEGVERALILRPTSETIIYPMFSLWLKSHADLPLKVHQSCEIYRYETKATRPLYRVREVPWNEAHTAHQDREDAERQFRKAVEIYSKVLRELGISYLLLRRPDFDKFAGAEYSVAFDAWNPDGRVNQVATIHSLGTNFARVFEIVYERRDGGKEYAWQLCYGMGYSRVLAAIIAQHGDDVGPVFPPEVAPIQVVIVPIPYKGRERVVLDYARRVHSLIGGSYRVCLDDREEATPGEKFFHWERMGVPLRIEVGPREAEAETVTLVRRHEEGREAVALRELVPHIRMVFEEMSKTLLERSSRVMRELVVDAKEIGEAAEAIEQRKICRASWCGSTECAMKIKERVGGEIRGSRYDVKEEPTSPCIGCGDKATEVVYIARAY